MGREWSLKVVSFAFRKEKYANEDNKEKEKKKPLRGGCVHVGCRWSSVKTF
jgi:hypothetical protein